MSTTAFESTAIATLPSSEDVSKLKTRLVYLGRRWFRLSRDVAEELVQSALLTYVEVRHRYPRHDEHRRILIGIFRNKCREHIGRSVRAAKKVGPIVSLDGATMERGNRNAGHEEGVLANLVAREDGRAILLALAKLRPQAREMFRLITEEGLTRKELIARFGLNANTLDSRLLAYRGELRKLLARADFQV